MALLESIHKGHLDGYLLHRTYVFNALRLFFFTNFPGPMFISCPTSIPDSRVNSKARPVVEGEHDRSWNDRGVGHKQRKILLYLFFLSRFN